MPKRKPSPEKKWLPLLGGSVLFGYLGCLPQGSNPATDLTAPHATGRDSVARTDTTAPIAVRPDTVRPPDPVIVIRTGPTLGEPCPRPDDGISSACTMEGIPVKCYQGILIEGPGPQISSMQCAAGDTIIHAVHMGFNGIDKAETHPHADLLVRRRMG